MKISEDKDIEKEDVNSRVSQLCLYIIEGEDPCEEITLDFLRNINHDVLSILFLHHIVKNARNKRDYSWVVSTCVDTTYAFFLAVIKNLCQYSRTLAF